MPTTTTYPSCTQCCTAIDTSCCSACTHCSGGWPCQMTMTIGSSFATGTACDVCTFLNDATYSPIGMVGVCEWAFSDYIHILYDTVPFYCGGTGWKLVFDLPSCSIVGHRINIVYTPSGSVSCCGSNTWTLVGQYDHNNACASLTTNCNPPNTLTSSNLDCTCS